MPSDESGRGPRVPILNVAADLAKAIAKVAETGPARLGSADRPPAEFLARGKVRDAVTALHNLENLLRSPSVSTKMLVAILPDFEGSLTDLREVFAKRAAQAKDETSSQALSTLCSYTSLKLNELHRAMKAGSDFDGRARLAFEKVVSRITVEVDAASQLLDLAERAQEAVPTEVALRELAQASLQQTAAHGEREVLVRLDLHTDDCLMSVDPRVLTRLLMFAAARAHAFGATEVSIQGRCEADCAAVRVEPSEAPGPTASALPMRLVRRIGPTDEIVEAAALAAGIGIHVTRGVTTFIVPRVPGGDAEV